MLLLKVTIALAPFVWLGLWVYSAVLPLLG